MNTPNPAANFPPRSACARIEQTRAVSYAYALFPEFMRLALTRLISKRKEAAK